MPLLDVLQSVPILSFLPVVLLSLSVILPQRTAAEVASIVLIFTITELNFGAFKPLGFVRSSQVLKEVVIL